MINIFRNYADNKRMVYEEPSIEFYSETYFRESCGGFEEFQSSEGMNLDAIRSYILSLYAKNKNHAALDVGCGRGELVLALSDLGVEKVVGIDLSEDSIALSKTTCAKKIESGQVTLAVMSCTKLEFPDDQFDVIFMTDVVEHLNDQNLKMAISEARRVLKPGGQLIIHTLPTVNYKTFGQYIIKIYFNLKGIEWWTPTSKEEVRHAGHVNIQSKPSMAYYLAQSFDKDRTRVYYGPARNEGAVKKAVGMLGLWSIFSPHLWAVAFK